MCGRGHTLHNTSIRHDCLGAIHSTHIKGR
jgi:hypothetical protein